MRDGRRKRLGLQEGTEGTVGDTYLDRILTDAEAAANPYTIAADTDVNFDTRDFRNISDTYNYYYGGGFDTAQDDATPPSSGDGGSGDGGTGSGTTPTTPNANTPEQQRLIDEGIGVQLEPGSPVSSPYEGMPPTQQELDDFNAIPVTNVAEFPTGDASLAEQIAAEDRAAKALANEQALTNQEDYRMSQYDSPTQTYYDGTATLEDAGAGEGDMYTTDFQGGEPLSFDDRNQSIEDIDRVNAPYGRNPITGEAYQTPRSIADQNAVLGQTFEADDVDADGNLVQKGIDKVKGLLPEGFDLGSALVKTAVNAAIGKPVTLFLDILGDILPEQDPRQTALNEFYKKDDIGRVAEGELMAGYNPVSGGLLNTLTGGRLGEETTYGLQDAYQRRIDTIEKTIARKTAADKNYDPTELQNRLVDLKAAKAEEANILDFYTGDTIGANTELDIDTGNITGDASIAEQIAEADRLGISGDIGVEGEDEDRFGGGADIDQDIIDKGGGDDISTGGLDRNRGQQVDRGSSGAGDNEPVSTTTGPPSTGFQPQSTYDAELEDDRDTGGGGNSSSSGGGCCFIMLESRYGDGTMDKVVRRYRDEKMTPRNRRGYYKMARVLVPLMRKSKVFKWIVTKTFADPLVSYGKWYYGENKHGWIFAPVKTAWLKIFDVVGTDTVFIRENGEEV